MRLGLAHLQSVVKAESDPRRFLDRPAHVVNGRRRRIDIRRLNYNHQRSGLPTFLVSR